MSKGWHFIALDLGGDGYRPGVWGPLAPSDNDCTIERMAAAGVESIEALHAKHAAFHEWVQQHGLDRS